MKTERDNTGRRGEALQELRIGQLLHTHQVHNQIRPQISRQARNKAAYEVVVEEMDRPKLGLGDAVRAAKIERDRLSLRIHPFAGRETVEKRVNLLLRQLPVSTHDNLIRLKPF